MGCAASCKIKEADISMNGAGGDFKREAPKEIKLLLLGAGESGKSTALKQVKIIYEGGYSNSERELYRSVVLANTIDSLIAILNAMKNLNIEFSDPSSEEKGNLFRNMAREWTGDMIPDLVSLMQWLWNDSNVQKCFSRSREYRLNDSAAYFLNALDRIGRLTYVPTQQDILRSREKSNDIVEKAFSCKGVSFKIIDIGSQRLDRKTWLQCCEGVSALIFCVALSEYDLPLGEEDEMNRMRESMKYFQCICKSNCLIDSSIIIFLNKKDIFEEKINHTPLTVCFPEYTGSNTYAEATSYIKSQFENLHKGTNGKDMYTHITCAIDISCMRMLFDNVIDTIIENNLQNIIF